MEKWEYKILSGAMGELNLNKVGADGWKLVEILKVQDEFYYYFQRSVFETSRKIWKYSIKWSPSDGMMGSWQLDELGADGWQLVCVIKVSRFFEHYFARPV